MPKKTNHTKPSTDDRLIRVTELTGEVSLLVVRYDGHCDATEPIEASELKYKSLFRVAEDDIVLSNINAVNGAIAVVPANLAGSYVTSEYTVLRAKSLDPRLVQLILRSPECRADLLLLASGIGRHRVRYSGASRTLMPKPKSGTEKAVLRDLDEAKTLFAKANTLQTRATERLTNDLAIDTPAAREILRAFKPPK